MEIVWNDLMTIGVQEIDEQHQTLIDTLNRLGEVMLGEQRPEEIQEILAFTVRYAQTHFQSEEAYFEQYDCPETQTNKQAHVQFVEVVDSLIQDFQEQGADISLMIKIHKFLVDWLLHHILEVDTTLRKYVK